MSHSDTHGCGHSHSHSHHSSSGVRLLGAIILNTVITVAEIIGGIMSGSLALLSDAFHNLSDVLSMVISYIAILIARKSRTSVKTYGFKRAEILAALINTLTLIGASVYIISEAVKRFFNPQSVNTDIMLIVALIGLAGNGLSIIMLFRDAKHNLNIGSAFLHLIGDTVSSVGVVAAALLMRIHPSLTFIDPLISVVIAGYIIKEGIHILLKTTNVLMQGKPDNVHADEIVGRLKEIAHVKDVHHIHLWTLTGEDAIFDAHVLTDLDTLSETDMLLGEINKILLAEFGISHVTVQIERDTVCTGECEY